MTYIRAWISSKFGQIRPWTTELTEPRLQSVVCLKKKQLTLHDTDTLVIIQTIKCVGLQSDGCIFSN